MNPVMKRSFQTIVAIIVVSLGVYVAEVTGVLTWVDTKWHKITVERHLWLGASFGDPATYQALWSSEAEDLGEQESSVVILLVPAGSRAAQLGLKKGDRVVSVNGKAILTPHQFKKVIRDVDRHTTLQVQVKRGSEVVSLAR
jgi:membrane-associated protease RseP (regulator of RpoE activity)